MCQDECTLQQQQRQHTTLPEAWQARSNVQSSLPRESSARELGPHPPSPSVIKAQVPLADDGLPHLFHLKKRARGYVCVCVSLACVGMYVCKLACICLWRMADKTAVVKIQVHVFQSGKNLSVSLQYLYVIRSNMIGTIDYPTVFINSF